MKPGVPSPVATVKTLFFDRPGILSKMTKAQRDALVNPAAKIRRTARGSMKPARRMRATELTKEQRRELGLPEKGGIPRSFPKSRLPYKSSAPGEPPRTRKSKALKRFLFFAYDPATNSAVVGPVPFGASPGAETLEKSGTGKITTTEPRPNSSGRRATAAQLEGLKRSGRPRRSNGPPRRKITKAVRIAARPYMRPALAQVIPEIPRHFQSILR